MAPPFQAAVPPRFKGAGTGGGVRADVALENIKAIFIKLFV
jgi:hypothetical protein